MPIWPTILTALVALYGAILSTYTVVVNRRDKKRRIHVKLSNGILTYGPEAGPAVLLIEATNPGNRTVILNGACIILPNKQQVVFPNPESNVEFPHALEEGNSCLVWTEMKGLAKKLRQQQLRGIIMLLFIGISLGMSTRVIGLAST